MYQKDEKCKNEIRILKRKKNKRNKIKNEK